MKLSLWHEICGVLVCSGRGDLISLATGTGDCYGFANQFSLTTPGRIVVHGVVKDLWDGHTFPHAWVEIGNKVYDYQTMKLPKWVWPMKFVRYHKKGWPKELFYKVFQPSQMMKYEGTESAKKFLEQRHHGPWKAASSALILSSNTGILRLVSPYENAPLECDGMTRILSHVLSQNGIPHKTFVGTVTVGGKSFSPHFWITVRGLVLDFRLRMWFGNGAPNGLFNPKQKRVVYDGKAVRLAPLPEAVFKAMVVDVPGFAFDRHDVFSSQEKYYEVALQDRSSGKTLRYRRNQRGEVLASRYETVLYGTKKGQPDYKEDIISTDPKKFEDAKKWAKKHGFDRFRVAKIDMSTRPDFTKTIAGKGDLLKSLQNTVDVDRLTFHTALRMARSKYGRVKPIGFNVVLHKLYFWFLDKDGSSHAIIVKGM